RRRRVCHRTTNDERRTTNHEHPRYVPAGCVAVVFVVRHTPFGVSRGSSMRVLMTGGGTGGHVTPAIAVAAALQELVPSGGADVLAGHGLQVLYIGGETGVERELVRAAGLPFWGIPAGPVRGQTPWRTAANLLRLLRGFFLALREIRRFQPVAVLATG